MKAILMAAGMGTRISTKTNEPKSLLDIGNGPLLCHTVKLLQKNKIDVIICTGFKGGMLKDATKDCQVTFYENPFYKVTNSIASLWFAKEELEGEEDIILANADVFWQQDILDILLAQQTDITLLADSSRRLTGDYFFQCKKGKLVRYGKDLKEEDRTSEYVGLALIKKRMIPIIKQRMEEIVEQGDYQFWWEDTLYSMIQEHDICVKDIAGHYWSEIDVLCDYENIVEYVKTHGIQK